MYDLYIKEFFKKNNNNSNMIYLTKIRTNAILLLSEALLKLLFFGDNCQLKATFISLYH